MFFYKLYDTILIYNNNNKKIVLLIKYSLNCSIWDYLKTWIEYNAFKFIIKYNGTLNYNNREFRPRYE